MYSRRTTLCLGAGLGATAFVPRAFAQQWPQKLVTVIVPYAAGGNTDGIARMTAQRLSEAFGKAFVVENRAGAGGAIAAEAAARAPADGYTLFIAPLPVMAIMPAINKVRFDARKNFAPISNIATNPFALVVNKDLPVKTLKEFVDYVRARKGELAYGSAGIGSLNHLSMALFLKQAGLEMTHVPYKGNAPALADVIGGQIPAMFSNLSDALPQANGGTVRMLAVSGDARAPLAPQVPTVAESGYPGFRALTWNGLMAPAGTPADIIDRIAKEIATAVKDPAFARRLTEYGADPLGNTPEEYKAMLASDITIWTEAVKAAGVEQQ
ncbi:tripartite tricarboxylate transporter substrate binding protein [Bradyrhizobium prioriisuperbiae]|uniref:Bug family tripartite tricarboxylate transporter substrate binding protein n=1 Tax=Bradyrhizobium prioriisuperbiae TaxID=2854389 RepID=UPI0028F11806|nr:tripartite tricarboxylate transporter substrate binding protein [Bradyrhizobium prioritasuperba]